MGDLREKRGRPGIKRHVGDYRQMENEMKGDLGMSRHEKEREREDAYTKTGSQHNPIPTSFFVRSGARPRIMYLRIIR